MFNFRARNSIRYYILLIVFLSFLFFSNDFGLLDIQKTAIILATGIDKEGEDFVLTTQIAVPQDSKQGKSTQAIQLVSKGKTVADAFEEINAKTGWYPKLVFCRLILLGENATKDNAFDGLDYFLRDEYFSDTCYLATCDGYAKDILNASALIDPSSSVAIEKVLSNHAARVGTTLPCTLREFAIGYFGESRSSFLPIIAMQPQQEPLEKDKQQNQATAASSDTQKEKDTQTQEKPVFSAKQTALFVGGKRVDTLTAEETFAYNTVKNQLRLAPYTLPKGKENCTLTIRRNDPKLSLHVAKDGRATLKIAVTLSAGILDYSKSQAVDDLADVGDVPIGVFGAAEQKLSAEITSVFEKSKANGCDLFGLRDLLLKKHNRSLHKFQDTLLQNTLAQVNVSFRGVR